MRQKIISIVYEKKAVIIHDLLESRLISKACFSICNCFAWAPLLHLTFFIFGSKVSQVSVPSKVPSCDEGLLFTPGVLIAVQHCHCLCVVFCLSVGFSPLTCFDTWKPKHFRTSDLNLAGATSLGLSLGCSFAPAASATLALRDLHKQAEHKGWLAYKGQWQMQFPLSFQTSLVYDF